MNPVTTSRPATDSVMSAAGGNFVMLKHNLRAARRELAKSRPAGGIYGIGRLQAGAVDRVLEVEGDEGVLRSLALARRARGR